MAGMEGVDEVSKEGAITPGETTGCDEKEMSGTPLWEGVGVLLMVLQGVLVLQGILLTLLQVLLVLQVGTLGHM